MERSEAVSARRKGLEPAVAALAELSARLACGGPRAWKVALRAGQEVATDLEIEEALLQAHLFVGFPIVLNAFIVWRELKGAPAAQSLDASPAERRAAGEALCRRVYGKVYERLRDNVGSLHPDLDRWMVEEGYGRTLSRPGLSPVARELCVIALLAAAGQERQLRAHLLGALNTGADRAEVNAALEIGVRAALDGPKEPKRDPRQLLDMWENLRSGSMRDEKAEGSG